jgi:hypothetical protein
MGGAAMKQMNDGHEMNDLVLVWFKQALIQMFSKTPAKYWPSCLKKSD